MNTHDRPVRGWPQLDRPEQLEVVAAGRSDRQTAERVTGRAAPGPCSGSAVASRLNRSVVLRSQLGQAMGGQP
jgi:hypothetical protein